MSLYDVVGVEADASVSLIRAAYRQKLMLLHPDKASKGNVSAARRDAARDLDALHHAWNVLRDQARRAQYDAQLVAQQCREQFEGVLWMSISVKEMDAYDTDEGHAVYEFECRCGDVFELAASQLPKAATVIHVTCHTCTSTLAVSG